MLKSHLYRFIKNKKNKILLFVLLILPSLDILMLLNELHGTMPKPNIAFFLTSITTGHMLHCIYLWFLPLYLLYLIADDSIQDFKTGYHQVLISKIGKKHYYIEKIGSSFLVCFVLMLSGLLLNLLLVHLFFYGGTYDPYDGDYCYGILGTLYDNHPLVANLIFSLVTSFFAGIAGMLGAAFSLLLKDMKLAYAATFFVWFVLVLKRRSIILLFQPFAEYGMDYMINIFITCILILGTIIIGSIIYEVFYDETV